MIINVFEEKVLIDDEDYELIKNAPICLKRINGKAYVIINNTERLHRVIMKASEPYLVVDHKDGNPLNNRKDNLRICSQRQNSKNRAKTNTMVTTSNFKGVHKYRGKWVSMIRVDYKRYYLGAFDIEEHAAMAYNSAAIRYFGDFARLNEVG